jgi:hypothetical protein
MHRSSFKGLDVAPVKSDGTRLDHSTGIDPGIAGYTLVHDTTYYYDLGPLVKEATHQSVHCKWDASIILTSISIEDSNLPDVSLTSATAGDWIHEDPTNAYVAAVGGTATKATVAVAGGSAGGCVFHLHGMGLSESARCRLKVVVAGTGGVLRVATAGKD